MIKLQGRSFLITHDETLTVTRTGVVQYIDGKPIHKGDQEFGVPCTIQPMSGKELLLVPEGDRTREQFWMWSQIKINVNDRVTRCGSNYQVQLVNNWGSFYQSRIMKIDVGPFACQGDKPC